MPTIIDYAIVLQQLQSEGLICNYFNGGSFGFSPDAKPLIRGWLGSEDPTIRPELRLHTKTIPQPIEEALAVGAANTWQKVLPGNIWFMPASHWSFELTHGNEQWLPKLLKSIDIDAGLLSTRTNASAVEFLPNEQDEFQTFLEDLLGLIGGSDYILAFPGRPTICTIHHHKQLWWVSTDPQTISALDEIV